MKFTKTTEYALRILSYMAMDENKLYTANDIFNDLKIPFRYLRKQLTILSKSGLMMSVQGIRGGYKMARRPDEIFLSDIVQATGENIFEKECFFGFQDCALMQKCAMHDKWLGVNEKIAEVLSTTNLAELKSKDLPDFLQNNNL